jgi:low temperature requirement protein LtrA
MRTSTPAPHQSEPNYEVTSLELFFDLVFVFAVSQLSRHLLEHASLRGAAETLVLLLAVFAVWWHTTWAAVIVPPDQPRTRGMVLTVMVLGLYMNASLTRAFATAGWAFVAPFLVVQLWRTVWTVRSAPSAMFREHAFRTLLWLIGTAPFWIVGAAASPQRRLAWWALAAVVDVIGTWLGHPFPGRKLESRNVEFPGGHMLERCRLFLIIALGETVLTTGAAIALAPLKLMTVVTGTAAMAGVTALWALGFGRAGLLVLRHVDETPDPVLATRHAGDSLVMMVAGLIALAVANEMVIAHPRGHLSAIGRLLLFGGPVLFLVAQAWHLRALASDVPLLRLVGAAALVMVGFTALLAEPFAALILLGASLTMLAVFDQRWMSASAMGRGRRSFRSAVAIRGVGR